MALLVGCASEPGADQTPADALPISLHKAVDGAVASHSSPSLYALETPHEVELSCGAVSSYFNQVDIYSGGLSEEQAAVKTCRSRQGSACPYNFLNHPVGAIVKGGTHYVRVNSRSPQDSGPFTLLCWAPLPRPFVLGKTIETALHPRDLFHLYHFTVETPSAVSIDLVAKAIPAYGLYRGALKVRSEQPPLRRPSLHADGFGIRADLDAGVYSLVIENTRESDQRYRLRIWSQPSTDEAAGPRSEP